jgi:hypothetical protein
MNHKFNDETPQFDVQLLFDEIGVALDDKQYRDIISLVDMYHVYMRQHQVSHFLNFASRSFIYFCSIGNSALLRPNLPPTALNTGSASRVRPSWKVCATDAANGHGHTLRSVGTTEIIMSIFSRKRPWAH